LILQKICQTATIDGAADSPAFGRVEKIRGVLMLFDLRVVLAACLATFLFAAIGFGLLAASRSPFKASAGYAQNDGRGGLAGPGLPKSRPLPLPETPEPETTGAIAEAPEAPPPEPSQSAPAKAAKAAKAAPLAAKKQSITSLIEEDKARENAAKEAKKAAAKKKPRHVRHKPKQPPKPANPWSVFTNNNNTTTAR
jgi:hypothetical protein